MDNQEAIELLRNMQNPLQDYAEMVCTPAFAYGNRYVYPEPEDYAIEEAISALEYRQKHHWHKVADGDFPVNSDRVLVYIKYKASDRVPPHYIANYAGGKWWYPSDREITGEAQVIAWMPLTDICVPGEEDKP